ncbi:TIGR02186 family protein [Enterovirga sp.]|uniref:TIGR02186 family protein n=1 Tax=Enterovirga sp. TaxID=2026350 RepID=UPI0026152ABD|nr:TIGR02186 family protein [Enterovirga sp.]MDB5592456.1 rane protein [Enterovirga sp.]
MRARLALLALACLWSGPALAERLVTSLSANQVAIGSNYTGAQLVIFGIIERDGQSADRPDGYDVVVTMRGPREPVTVRRKEPFGPVWLNRSQQKFVAVPSVLTVLSSRYLAEIAPPALRAQLRLGLAAIVQAPEFTIDRGQDDNPFRAGLIRLKTRDGLWSQHERGVVFVTREFFRAPMAIPATATIGNYDVEVILLSGGAVLARGHASFEVVKTGFEEQITVFAQDRSLIYGMMIGALSLAFGWVASVIFRRD